MQIDATANGISRRCTLMRSYHSQLKLRDQTIYFISISWGQNILPHFPFRHRKGRVAFKPSATDDESRGNAFGGWGVGRKSPPHCKAKEAETLVGFNLGARHRQLGNACDFNASAKCQSALFNRTFSSRPATARVRGWRFPSVLRRV